MVVSNNNKGAPNLQGGNSGVTDHQIIPRTYEGNLYYATADVARVIGVTKQAVIIAKRLPI